ncbi:Aldo keto reductase [Calocera viscosa TUFC12733]|uniref:Aldo keto reductase n=1 Tax=Calocera viscosa (strain TUFC12733) TaxID=1330018 RepID=A0A167HS56_CALVF|nr:Aldo keto reductase [Calocera viscosa TUFC12733]
MSMPTRALGDAQVSAIGFGAMGIGGYCYGADAGSDEERFRVLDRAYELGCRFWDTANIYGDSEELIGHWFARNPEKRKDIFLATKFGFRFSTILQVEMQDDGRPRFDAGPENVKESCTLALKKLQVEQIDLFYAHRVDPKVPIEITVRAMAELVKEGKVRNLGLSDPSASALRRAYAVHPIAAVQVEYAPITLDIEDPKIGLLDACRELGVKVIPWSPLGRGILTGQYRSPDEFPADDYRRYVPRFSVENFPKVLLVADTLKDIADKHGATAGQVALAWILAQGEDFIPIPGTKNIKYLEQNIGAAYVKLTQEEVAKVRKAAIDSGTADTMRMVAEHAESSFQDSPPLEGYKA